MTATTDSPVVEYSSPTEEDRAAIRRIIADTETAYNTNDAELMTKHFARNATVVNAMGVTLSGVDAILESTREGLAGFLRDEHVRYDVLDILFVRPDVALAYKGARATDAKGNLVDDDHVMKVLYVVVKQDERWWTVARHHTLVC
ncbi:SgcJ/EcaC family oxidoreductase [Saccharomonospora azurea]|uniref:SgcJ/EcaC family oxidoreductase n=1 Tax=Saccharomonospora azurea TaxID=40988 RepID=UPI003D8C06D9